MKSFILLIGDVPDRDLRIISSASSLFGIEIRLDPDYKYTDENNIPSGCISYVKCTPEGMLDLFGNQPIGFGEDVPVFQKVDQDIYPEFLNKFPVQSVFRSPLTPVTAHAIISAICSHDRQMNHCKDLMNEIIKYRRQKFQLIQIGTALSIENDLKRLLELILLVSRDIVDADAGSIYVREREGAGGHFKNQLKFKVAQNDSIDLGRMQEFPVEINDNSISGYVALTGRSLTVDDVYELGDDVPYRFGKDYERRFGYRVKSMLTIPLRNLDEDVVGVLQLMNKKRRKDVKLVSPEIVEREVVPFSIGDEDFVNSIASHAAVSIERADLYENIKALFEGFLGSSIAAIDERDRVTSGHSKRVMGYAMAFAKAASLNPQCPFAEIAANEDRIRQFQFAALLHDIGKIGVPERLLTKESRLDEGRFAAVMARLDYIALLLDNNAAGCEWDSRAEIDKDREFLRRINQQGFLSDDDAGELEKIHKKEYTGIDGGKRAFLTDEEHAVLSVRAGNLTAEEREIINSHALSTYRILSKIPWTRQLEKIPAIACSHHERIDGTGYPHGLKNDQIFLESKVLAVIDIYEALVAQDRPYKPKMAPEKAIGILRQEVDRGHLDRAVVDFFIDQGIYKLYMD